jgi:nitrite reductase/ring-hydroxylating ferredoxin subunit
MEPNDPKSTPTSLKGELARLPLSTIPDVGAISLDIDFKTGRQSVIALRRSGQVRAFLNRCPHARWPLDTFDGRFLFTPEGALMCAAHAALFDPLSGVCLGGPGQGLPLTAVAFKTDRDEIVFEDGA